MSVYGSRGVHGHTVETIARRVLSGEPSAGGTLGLTALQQDRAIGDEGRVQPGTGRT